MYPLSGSRVTMLSLNLLSLFIQSKTTTHGIMPPKSRVGLPSQINSLGTPSYSVHMCMSQVISNAVEFTMKTR